MSLPWTYSVTQTWLEILKGEDTSVNHKAKIPGYNKRVWFSIRAITNIITLKKLTEQYRVTYDEQIFQVWNL